MANLDIIDARQVILLLTNRSGGALNDGDVVIIDITNDESFTTTTVVGSVLVTGVVQEDIANLAVGRVLVEGYAPVVEVNDATARGDFLKTSGVATRATSVVNMDLGVFAKALTSTVGAGQVSAELFGISGGQAIGVMVRRLAAQSIPSGVNTAVIFDTEDRDDDNFWVVGTPTRMTAQVAGWHDISVYVNWASSALNVRYCMIGINGGLIAGRSHPAPNDLTPHQTVSRTYWLAVGDFVEIYVAQIIGGPLNLVVAQGSMVRL